MKFTAQLVAQLADAFASKLNGFNFEEAFSGDKDELVIVFQRGNEFISLSFIWRFNNLFLLFSDEQKSKPTPHNRYFNELKGLSLNGVFRHNQNRSFHIELENGYSLLFKLYGALGNVFLLQNNLLLYHFRKTISADYAFDAATLFSEFHPETARKIPSDSDVIYELNSIQLKELKTLNFEEKKKLAIQGCRNELKRCQQLRVKSASALLVLKQEIPSEEIGHILMANLHVVPSGIKEITLDDFYRNTPITIRLKEQLTAQQNAEYYYRKSRNRKLEEQELLVKIKTADEQIKHLTEELATLEQAGSTKALRQLELPTKKETDKTTSVHFHLFELDGYKILVGKKATSNDELTFKIASKNDWWLHAKDVSGSHVIVKSKTDQAELPGNVLAYAASLAAGFSKSQHSLMVPVMYTQRKLVRKPKGALPGEVVCERYELIMAEPYKKTRGPKSS